MQDLTSGCMFFLAGLSLSVPLIFQAYVCFICNVQGFYFYLENREEYIKFLEVKVLDIDYAIPLLINIDKKEKYGDFLVVQWLRVHDFKADVDLVPNQI